jgi:hypothetical protein
MEGRPATAADALDDLSALSVRQLRQRLAEAGINSEGCIEKSDLISKLQEHRDLHSMFGGFHDVQEQRRPRVDLMREGRELLNAAKSGNAERVVQLLKARANVNYAGEHEAPWHDELGARLHGETPLHLAARAGHAQVVMELLLAGADAAMKTTGFVRAMLPNFISGVGQRPLDYARNSGRVDVVRILDQPDQYIREWSEASPPGLMLQLSCPPKLVMSGLPLLLSGWNGEFLVQKWSKNGMPVWQRPAHTMQIATLVGMGQILGVSVWWEPERQKWVLHRDEDDEFTFVAESIHSSGMPVGSWQLNALVRVGV